MRTNVQDTSIDAYRSMPVRKRATQADQIHSIVETFCSSWGKDLSLNEIKRLWRRLYKKDIELSTVSARVNELVAAGRLERLDTIRKCTVIKDSSIHPVRIPEGQRGLFQ